MARIAKQWVWGLMVVVSLMIAAPARADEKDTEPTMDRATIEKMVAMGVPRSALPKPRREHSRIVTALVVGLAVLQVADVTSTVAAMKVGAIEANPLMATTKGSVGKMLAIKAATTPATVYSVKKIEKHNKAAAIATMAVANAATAGIVGHNYTNASVK